MNFRSSFTPRSKQQGNTFIGIIIGLVIGLSIAVVVALMITKGSTPFTDKGQRPLARPAGACRTSHTGTGS
jgi:cell division protein FtsN